MKKNRLQQTLVLIKPDALKNSMTGYVLSQLSEVHCGIRFAGAKIVNVSHMMAEEHYVEHQGKPFFQALIDYLTGAAHYPDEAWKRRVIALVYHGENAIEKVRRIAGPTNPHDARETQPGSIRSLGTVVSVRDKRGKIVGERMDNLVHASADEPAAEREIKLWFKPNDIPPAMHLFDTGICQDMFSFQKGRILKNHQGDSICLLAPGDTVWTSDLDTLNTFGEGKLSDHSVKSVIVKYLINETRDSWV
ncbi:nucleoside-diphosphate kinase [bacterium]|nr:nucleoside-diphosphate kinase [bacterium]